MTPDPTSLWTLVFGIALGIALGAPLAYVVIQRVRTNTYRSAQGHRDDTDMHGAQDTPTENKRKSGLYLFVDYRTGVHYVGNPTGGLTPRIYPDGSLVTESKTGEAPHVEGPRSGPIPGLSSGGGAVNLPGADRRN
ncbi:hypothetical protein CKO28_00070 [Rhodovibrio sodomensis]|uniref:DUF3592 domain-containing protein n=1 Tax=Rhodovibrio sodomensis TaxID=1088 RepID=A0ABS1D866_9PROT|nr:hypothetical protein [Rhodovibrio sodomensis]MBK1666434.1 hypothetical protein [Rhodovibrio sodomensis]